MKTSGDRVQIPEGWAGTFLYARVPLPEFVPGIPGIVWLPGFVETFESEILQRPLHDRKPN